MKEKTYTAEHAKRRGHCGTYMGWKRGELISEREWRPLFYKGEGVGGDMFELWDGDEWIRLGENGRLWYDHSFRPSAEYPHGKTDRIPKFVRVTALEWADG